MKNKILLLVSAIVYATVVSVPAWADSIKTEEIIYHGDTKGYLALPDANSGERSPAVVLIHEWWGLNDNIRAEAQRYAKAGYVALAVDLYDGESASKPEEARALAGKVRSNMDEAFANLRSAFSYLQKHSGVYKERIASVGWCFGGGWAYQIAKNNLGAKASIIYYGRFNPADDLTRMRAKIMGHFAENDRGIRVDDVRQFQAKLKTLSGDHEIFIYPNAGHGFANPGNAAHDPQATQQSNQRTLEFLQKYL